MTLDYFSLPQILGYATFLLSMVTFSQKQDHRLKIWMSVQTLFYASHLYLMGNPAAAAGALLAVVRNMLSLRTRAWSVALLLLFANVLLGVFLVKAVWNVLPLLAVAIATVSIFRLEGMQMRLGVLCASLLWLVNNILTGSIGGTALELMIATVNSITIFRLYRAGLKQEDPLRISCLPALDVSAVEIKCTRERRVGDHGT